ncbi:MAG: shikimate kinase, partial [Phycisphaerales bacterium]
SESRAVVVFVDVDAETVRQRIIADGAETRPPILGVDAVAEVDEVLAQRRPSYLRISDLRVEPRNGDPIQIARTLAAMIRNWIAARH